MSTDKKNGIIDETKEKRVPKALLVSVYSNSAHKNICEEHLEELALLSETYGMEVIEKVPCFIRKYDASTFVTKGKLEELVLLADELNVDLVVFDDEIAPSQQRNLEEAFKREVIDRTAVILRVFAQRAQTKEARLQVELAEVRYQAPRLKRLWSHLSRQHGSGGGGGGGGGYTKGEGEKQIEIDRRILKKKIDTLQKEIEEVKAIRDTQRTARERSGIPVFAILGYTNAGKSTLLNALTDANVFVEDKLFATLDTTTRKFTLKNNQDILLIDTVGFIRKLPHLLVAAFKSTLEESLQADVVIHLIDSSHHMAEEQALTTFEVLEELGAKDKNILTVLNKVDKLDDPDILRRLMHRFPKTAKISALKHEGFDELQNLIIEELSKQRKVFTLRIPQSEYAIVSEATRLGNIIETEYEDDDVVLKVDIPAVHADKFKKYVLQKS